MHLYGTMPSQKHRLGSKKPYRNALFTSYFTSPAECHTPTCYLLQTSPRCPVVETTSLAIFFSVLPTLHPVYIISFPHPDLMQLHLDLDNTKFTQDRPPVQSDRLTVPSCNMALLTTRTGLPTVNIHPSRFTHVDDFN